MGRREEGVEVMGRKGGEEKKKKTDRGRERQWGVMCDLTVSNLLWLS